MFKITFDVDWPSVNFYRVWQQLLQLHMLHVENDQIYFFRMYETKFFPTIDSNALKCSDFKCFFSSSFKYTFAIASVGLHGWIFEKSCGIKLYILHLVHINQLFKVNSNVDMSNQKKSFISFHLLWKLAKLRKFISP